MEYPINVKGNIIENDEELHYLLECDIISFNEYSEIIDKLDYKKMEEKRNKEEYEQKIKTASKRVNWKKECIRLNQIIVGLEDKILSLQHYINELEWKCAGK